MVVAQICRERIPYSLTLAQVEALEPVLPHIREVAEHYAAELSDLDLLEPFTGLARVAGQWSPGEALRWNEQGLKECEERLGPKHPYTAAALNNLAALLKTTNRLKEAEPLLRRALAIAEYELITGPSVATALNNLAQLLQATNRLVEAEPLMRRALAIDEASYGNDHPRVAITLGNLGLLMKDTNHLAEAESLMRRALAIHESSNGIDNPDLGIALNNLALLMRDTNRLAEAEALIERSFSIFVGSFGLDHPNTQRASRNFTSILHAQGLPEPEIQAKFESLQPSPPTP
jgi:tetratricopeptide (TPR) repeat protein